MSEAMQMGIEFGDPVLSTMLNHGPRAQLVGTQEEIEHRGVLQALHELVDGNVPLNEPIVGMLLTEADLVSFAFWSGEPRFVQSATALIRGEQTYDRVIQDGFWNRVLSWLNDFDVESEHRSAFGLRLPVAEIHAPHIEGCVGTFATTRTGALDVSIKAFGLGYQRVKRVTINASYELPSACGVLTTGVQFVVHVWKHRFSDKRRALIHMINIDGSMSDKPLKASDVHPCNNNYREFRSRIKSLAAIREGVVGVDYRDIPMHGSTVGAISGIEMKLEKGTVYSASLELPFTWRAKAAPEDQKPPTLGISIESRVARTVEMSWKLASGHDYMAFRAVRGDMRMFWVWD